MAASMNSTHKGLCIFSTINNTFRLTTIDSIPTSESSPVYLGCMISNMTGKQFSLFDYRARNPQLKVKSSHVRFFQN